MKSSKAIVVGSGIAGIATAIRLAVKGYGVDVYEANNYIGGKLTAFSSGNYRFDSGPSLFTLPYLVDELFTLANRNPADYFKYHKIETACHYFWEDGTFLKAYSNHQEIETEVENVFPTNGKLFTKKLKKASTNIAEGIVSVMVTMIGPNALGIK